jgi:putative ABC transport system permease protein
MHTFLQDLRYGVRMLVRNPGFALIGIATLALGIGANTAIFSVVNALLLRPLPYPNANELVMVWQDLRGRGGPIDEWATPGNLADWQSGGLFKAAAAVQGWQPSFTGAGEPEPLVGEQVTREYLDVLGIRPALGRTFRTEEDIPDGPRVVILSHALWQRRFGGDPAVLGRSITLSGEAHEIVGVMPPRFRPAVITDAEVWRPRRLNLSNPSRGAIVLRVIARLKPDVSLEQTSSNASVLAKQLERAHPDSNTGAGINIVSLHTQVVGDIRAGLLVLLGAVGFVLLIACANIANLLLARASGRGREIAVRVALGAARHRLVQQLLTESLLLAAIGGAVGVLVGVWGVQALIAIAPRNAPRIDEIGLDPTVLVFALGLTILTGVLFGLVPALETTRPDVAPALKEGGRGTAGPSSRRARHALVVVELAVALVLLVGSGLLLRTFLRLQHYDLGFEPDRVLVGGVLPPRVAYPTRDQQVTFFDRLLARVSVLPGVETAALSSIVPLGGDSDMSMLIEGRPMPRNEADTIAVWYRLVSPGYFKALQIPFREGRNFEPGEAAPGIIVSEASVRRLWNGRSPVGSRVRFSEDPKAPWFTVIGVVGEVRMRGPRGESRNEVYLAYWQFTELGTNVVLKTSSRPEALASALRQAVRDVDPNIPVSGIGSMSQIVAESIDQPRFVALLVGVFALLALTLAGVGIYGVMASAVSQRTAEIGVRMALGASPRDVFALVVSDGLKLAAVGIGLGAVAAVGMSLTIRSQLFGVEPVDPLTFGATTVALALAAAVACFVPARRATRVDPIMALRTE